MTLISKHCKPDAPALDEAAIHVLLPQVAGWAVIDGKLQSSFTFKNYYETMAFVNAMAWVSHQQDHHPELMVSYKLCAVSYSTHSAGGELSENDFICAAKVSALYVQRDAA
ncbi:MAG: 4a-hydroxytetrahydrobiopterin dehydratase [Pseudomonadota bacterium]